MTSTHNLDTYRFTSNFTKRTMKAWAKRDRQQYQDTPWTPLRRPLSESKIAFISTAAVALKTDLPFDQQGERDNPWWGDPTYRRLPASATAEDVTVYHLHINTDLAHEDLNTVLPLASLHELAQKGVIGQVAETHYSFMGYILEPEKELLSESTPAIIENLQAEQVDGVVLVPV
jgi:D-proline reductase (dithiol) PrdB